ncbi:uncharacterized protein LOC144912542 [Branchiostoma floridae x Branchiostoma belcheri]
MMASNSDDNPEDETSMLVVCGGEIGVKKKNNHFCARTNFSLEVLGVFHGDTEGFVFKVKHAVAADGQEPKSWLVPVKTADTSKLGTFEHRLNERCKRSLWLLQSQSMKNAFPIYLHKLTNDYLKRASPDPTVYKVAEYIGKQPGDPPVWVLGESLQLSEDGLDVPVKDRYIWDVQKEPTNVVAFENVGPQDRTGGALRRLFLAMKDYFQPKVNWPASATLMGGLVMSLHYDLVVANKGKAPIVIASGPPAVGKTTALKACLSVVGRTKAADFSEAGAMQEAAKSSLPFGWDDPLVKMDLGKVAMKLFNQAGKMTINKKSTDSQPKSLPVVTANFNQCDTEAMTSRLAVISFVKSDQPHDVETEDVLSEALDKAKLDAPKAIASLIGLGKVFVKDDGQAALKEVENKLKSIFPPGSPRTTQVYSLPVWFTQKCLTIAGMEEEMDSIWEYMGTTVAQLLTDTRDRGPAEGNQQTAGESREEVLDAIETAVSKMNLREINMCIRLTTINWGRDRVICIYPEMLRTVTGDHRFHRDDLKRTTTITTRTVTFLSPDSPTPIFRQKGGKDTYGKSYQKKALIIHTSQAPKLAEALKERTAALQEGDARAASSRENTEGSTLQNKDESTPQNTESMPQNTDESLPQNTDESTPQNTNESMPQNTDESLPQNTDESTPQNTQSTLQNTDESLPQNTDESTPQNIDASMPQNTDESMPQNTQSTLQNTNESLPQNTDESTPQNTQSTLQNTDESLPQNTDKSTPQNIDASMPQNTDESMPQNTQSSLQNTEESLPQNTDESMPQNTQSTLLNTDESLPQNTDESTPQNTQSTLQNTDESLPQNTDKSTPQNIDASMPQNTDESMPQNTQSTLQNTDESLPQNTDKSTPQNIDASMPQNTDESMPQNTQSTLQNTDESLPQNTDESTPQNTQSTLQNTDESTAQNTQSSLQNTDESMPQNTDESTPQNTDESTPQNTDESTPQNTDESTPQNTDETTTQNTDEPSLDKDSCQATRKSTRKRKIPVKMAMWKKLKKN